MRKVKIVVVMPRVTKSVWCTGSNPGAPAGARSRGFTLVELMIVVAIVGVLAALAIYGVRKYISNAKTVEARNSLGIMSKSATSAYARETMVPPDVMLPGASSSVVNRLCVNAATPVPPDPAKIAGRKYQSSPAEWQDNAGWTCLRFSMTEPQYYMYNYVSTGSIGAGATFSATAQGDLNGDALLSTFEVDGEIVSTATGMEVFVSPNIREVDAEE